MGWFKAYFINDLKKVGKLYFGLSGCQIKSVIILILQTRVRSCNNVKTISLCQFYKFNSLSVYSNNFNILERSFNLYCRLDFEITKKNGLCGNTF